MAIPEAQLSTWSSLGSITQSANTYATLKNALESPKALYNDRSYEVFLQGSYCNDTNIYAESDVDVVMRLTAIMRSDLSSLPADQQTAYHETYGKATYTYSEFKDGVFTRLKNAFGAGDVHDGDKAFHIEPTASRRSSDVVTCYQYRRYIAFGGMHNQQFVPGIIIPNTSNGDVINYPKVHSENLTSKHQSTKNWFKPIIRIFKNARNRLITERAISDDTACSYYIECMLYNVPDTNFGSSYADTFCKCINWLRNADRSKLVCANRQYWLMGNLNVQWASSKFDAFLKGLVELWNNW